METERIIRDFENREVDRIKVRRYLHYLLITTKSSRSFKILSSLKTFTSLKSHLYSSKHLLVHSAYFSCPSQPNLSLFFHLLKQSHLKSKLSSIDLSISPSSVAQYNLEAEVCRYLSSTKKRAVDVVKRALERKLKVYLDRWTKITIKQMTVF